MIYALEVANEAKKRELKKLMDENPVDKVEKVLVIFRESGVDKWAIELKEKYFTNAFQHLEDIAVTATRKEPLKKLANFLVQREY